LNPFLARSVSYAKQNWKGIWLAICAAVLIFLYGLAVGRFEVFPYAAIETLVSGSREWLQSPWHNAGIRPEKFLRKPRGPGRGVVINDPAAYPGQTFMTGFFGKGTGMRLVDREGRTLHEWHVSFSAIWPDTSHVTLPPRHDWETHIHGAVLYPNGDVIFNFSYVGLARIDRCSRVLWKLPLQTHHSVLMANDGSLWVPSRRLRTAAVAKFPGLEPPFMEELVLEISPQGKVLREISILDVIYGSRYEGLLSASGSHAARPTIPADGDFTHLNDIEVLEAEMAPAFPQFQAGDLLLSLRNLNLILVVDRQTERIKWAMTGPFVRQHDPDFLPSGRVSVFDNRRDERDGRDLGGARILEVDPQTHRSVTVYGEREKEFFYTETQGDHQRLPNGNILITESEYGHVFEVDAAGKVVWSFVNRWDDESVAEVERATRYPEGYLALKKERCT
jgi:hypothetical protein